LLGKLSIREYLEKTASREPLPGGGSAAALMAALAAGLVEMVAHLTLGRKGYAGVQGAMAAAAGDAKALRERLAEAVDRDSEAYRAVMAALRLPRASPGEAEARRRSIEEAYREAVRVPMEVAEGAASVLALAGPVAAGGYRVALTDAVAAVHAARAALHAAAANVRVNLSGLEGGAWRQAAEERIRGIEARGEETAAGVLSRAGS